jgi:hypothetical protein
MFLDVKSPCHDAGPGKQSWKQVTGPKDFLGCAARPLSGGHKDIIVAVANVEVGLRVMIIHILISRFRRIEPGRPCLSRISTDTMNKYDTVRQVSGLFQ